MSVSLQVRHQALHYFPTRRSSDLFYAEQRFTLNATRADMRALGFSPSVRLFEAAACGTPVISDRWPGIETVFERSEEHTSELQSHSDLVCRLLLEKKK